MLQAAGGGSEVPHQPGTQHGEVSEGGLPHQPPLRHQVPPAQVSQGLAIHTSYRRSRQKLIITSPPLYNLTIFTLIDQHPGTIS